MTKIEDVYAICCRLEAAGDVISVESVKTVAGYVVLNFEVGSSSSFRDIKKHHFVTPAAAEAGAADIDDSIKRQRIRLSLKNADHVSIKSLVLQCCQSSAY